MRKAMLSLICIFLFTSGTSAATDHAYPYRMVWMWENMDKGLLHVPRPSFFSREDLLKPDAVPRYVEFAKQLRSMKVNGLIVTVSFNDHSFTEITPQLRALSEFLKGYGIGTYLHVPYAGYKSSGEESFVHCPYDPRFTAYWSSLADKLFKEVPLLKGYVMKGTGYEGIPGPLNCGCSTCQGKSESERILQAFEVLCSSVKKHKGQIFYRTWTTGALQDVEHRLFSQIAGKTPSNLALVSKAGYGDFGIHEIPHPLFGNIHPKTPHIAEFQIFGEYRGTLFNPCQMVTYWRDRLDEIGDDIDGLMGIVEVDRNTFDHPLNMVNWYAFGRYASDRSADPDKLLLEWSEDNFGKYCAPALVKVLKKTSEATRKLMYLDGVWVQEHSFLPSRSYLDSHLRGPWAGMPRDEKKIGWGRPLNMYSPETAAKYSADPELRLFLNRVEITPDI